MFKHGCLHFVLIMTILENVQILIWRQLAVTTFTMLVVDWKHMDVFNWGLVRIFACLYLQNVSSRISCLNFVLIAWNILYFRVYLSPPNSTGFDDPFAADNVSWLSNPESRLIFEATPTPVTKLVYQAFKLFSGSIEVQVMIGFSLTQILLSSKSNFLCKTQLRIQSKCLLRFSLFYAFSIRVGISYFVLDI